MAEDFAERTEPATPKRRADARRKGEVAQSRDLAAVALLAAALALLGTSLAAGLLTALAEGARTAWSGALVRPETLNDFHAVLLHQGAQAARAFAPLGLLLIAVAIAAHVLQIGPLFSLEALAFRPERMSPARGFQRMFGRDSLFELGKAAFKMAVVGLAAWSVVDPALGGLLALTHSSVPEGLLRTGALSQSFVQRALGGLAVLALADFLWARRRFERKLRMTREEVREEVRQREGSPQVRGRQRQRQRELSRLRMIAAVAEADVVVTNPTHYAVALRYARQEMRAPKVVAKGRNHVALRIRRAAEEHGVPIVENPPLAQLLHRTARLDREIPETLFQAVAEVLAYVFRLDPRRGSAWRSPA